MWKIGRCPNGELWFVFDTDWALRVPKNEFPLFINLTKMEGSHVQGITMASLDHKVFFHNGYFFTNTYINADSSGEKRTMRYTPDEFAGFCKQIRDQITSDPAAPGKSVIISVASPDSAFLPTVG